MVEDGIAHVPGPVELPVLGSTPAFLRDASALLERNRRRYGDVFRVRVLGRDVVVLLSPDAVRDLYLDRGRALSSEGGWEFSIGPMFRRGLMLRDFDDHHRHRLVLAQAFRRNALQGYTAAVHEVVDARLAVLAPGPVDVYAVVKRLMLDVASVVFVGAALGRQAETVNAAFVAMMRASTSPVRLDVPGTAWHRGVLARRRLVALLTQLVEDRRREDSRAPDLLTRLACSVDGEGRRLPTDEVVDHLAFLLLAAHDTTTASLSVMLQQLAAHPAWQEQVAREVAALDGSPVSLDNAAALPATGRVLREAMRLQPPVPFSPRLVVAPVELGGVRLPPGTTVSAASLGLHRHPEWWSEPDSFDPDRFSDDRAEDRQHTHLYVPFGGGAHLCIGNHMAELLVKSVVARLLTTHRVRPGSGSSVTFRPVPIPRPRRPLVLTLA